MDIEDPLTEIRMKYAEDLEDILECPVCYELPKGDIKNCTRGHHICSMCMSMLQAMEVKCPTCNCSFSNSRNYAVEKLIEKFQDIKSSILDPRHESNRRIKKVSVYIQTESIIINEEKSILTDKLKNKDFAKNNNSDTENENKIINKKSNINDELNLNLFSEENS